MEAFKSWYEEKQSAYLYRLVARKEPQHQYQQLFLELADAAEKQALIWEQQLHKQGYKKPLNYRPNLRTYIAGFFINLFGPRQIQTMLAAMKVRGMSIYSATPVGHPSPRSLADVGRSHRGIKSGNNLRAAIFGVNDGLVSNMSLILGIAGATTNQHMILLAGVAGLLAGAFSMGAGEYISVRSQREMYEYQIALEKQELDLYPEEETEELALIYEARGLHKEEAYEMAKKIMRDPVNALDVLAREELGLNPQDLASPWGAAFSSFFSFTVGAIIPLVPFFLGGKTVHLLISIGLSGLFLFTIGLVLSLYTGKNALWGGCRMLVIGTIAGAVTFCMGKLFGLVV